MPLPTFKTLILVGILSLTAIFAYGSLTARIQGDRKNFTLGESAQAVIFRTNDHNQIVCSSTNPISEGEILSNTDISNYFVYEKTENEPPFLNDFIFSSSMLRRQPKLASRNTLTTITNGKMYYIRTDRDLIFDCNTGELETVYVCGNGVVEGGQIYDHLSLNHAGEECDDGNNDDGDGCDSECKNEDEIITECPVFHCAEPDLAEGCVLVPPPKDENGCDTSCGTIQCDEPECAQNGELVYLDSQSGHTVCCNKSSGIKSLASEQDGLCVAPNVEGVKGVCKDKWAQTCGNGKCEKSNDEDKCNCAADCTGDAEQCLEAGETQMSFSGAPQCCDGLNTIIIASKVNGECTAPSSLPGLNVSICSNCGDGTCEAWENECNCITDCPSSPPTDDDPLDPACGDGVITPSTGEVCDDKNTDVFDGCDDKCKKEIGWKCEGEPSVCEMLIPSAGTQTQEPINVTPKMRE